MLRGFEMTNIRLKKTESANRQKENLEQTNSSQKDESFPETSDVDLTGKRKMILTGITAGVGVAGATAAGLLFFGPYSPFGVKSPEKQDKIASDKSVSTTNSEDKSNVLPPPPTPIAEPSKTVVASAPSAHSTPKQEEVKKATHPEIAISQPIPASPLIKPETPKSHEKPVEEKKVAVIPPPFVSNKEASGPETYNYDIQDGGPILNVPVKKKIIVSRDPNFQKIYLNGNSNVTGQYRISIPPPGEVYWKEDGKEAHKIKINPPESTGIRADIPAKLKLKDTLSWTITGKVSFYRVEVASDMDFLNRVKVFSTVKNSFPVESIGQGKWFIKISALNLQSGSWDSTKTFPVNIEEQIIKQDPIVTQPPVEENKNQEAITTEVPKDPPVVEQPPVDDAVSKPVEPVNPVEATVPDKPAQPATDE